MSARRWCLPLLILVFAGSPAQAGILFWGKKKPKPDPMQRVPELLEIVKTSPDESKRVEAADELRKYDVQQFPEIVPTLINVLMTDAKPGVRSEAAQSLGSIRPVSQEVGMALEQALAKDSSMRVRLQARSSLLSYRWHGYKSPKKETPTTKEPPLAPPLPAPHAPTPIVPPTETAPPPLQLDPPPSGLPKPLPSAPIAKPLPSSR